MLNLGTRPAASVIDFTFQTTRLSDGAPIALTSGTVSVYKANSTTQTTTGVTLTANFDSVTGLNHVRIVTTDAFYASGVDYSVVLTAGTVDSVSVVGSTVSTFRLEARSLTGPAERLLIGKSNLSVWGDSYVGNASPSRSSVMQCWMTQTSWLHRGVCHLFGGGHPSATINATVTIPTPTTVARGGTYPGTSGIVNRLPWATPDNWVGLTNPAFATLTQWIPYDSGKIPAGYDTGTKIKGLNAFTGTNGPLDMAMLCHRTPNSFPSLVFEVMGASSGDPTLSALLDPAAAHRAILRRQSVAWPATPGNIRPNVTYTATAREFFWYGAGFRASDMDRGIVLSTELANGGWGAQHFAYEPGAGDPTGLGQYTDLEYDAFFAAHAAFDPINVVALHVGTNNAAETSTTFRSWLRLAIARILRLAQPYSPDPVGVLLFAPAGWLSSGGVDQTATMAIRRDDMYAVAAEFGDAVQVVDVHQAMLDLYGPTTSWASTYLIDEGGGTRLHVTRSLVAATAFGAAIDRAMVQAVNSAATLSPTYEVRSRLRPTRLTQIDATALQTTAAEILVDTGTTIPASVDVLANPKLGVTLRASGADLIADITAAGEAISLYNLRVRMLQATPEGARRADLLSSAIVSPTASIVTVTFANAAARLNEDLDLIVSATTTESGALPTRRIPWRPGEVAAGNNAVLDAIVGSSGTVTAEDISPKRTWGFPGTGSRIRASNTVEVAASQAGTVTVCFDLDGILEDNVVLASITSTAITGTAATLGTAVQHTSKRKVNIPLTNITATAGVYTLTLTFVATDSEQYVVKGTLEVV